VQTTLMRRELSATSWKQDFAATARPMEFRFHMLCPWLTTTWEIFVDTQRWSNLMCDVRFDSEWRSNPEELYKASES
jgi:hypothetical protein